MRRALRLARRGVGRTQSNPRVGALLARRGRIVAEGWHQALGGPHAEPQALQGHRGDTLYVTLEPCIHQGRTPPCTESILRSGVSRVVVATVDPDPRVRGRGLARLRRHGIEVEVGLLQDEARRLNGPYFLHRLRRRPQVTLKVAVSADGRLAVGAGESKWITGPRARRLVRSWRARADAVAVGVGTVLADDPLLTGPPRSRRNPVRVVLDEELRTPPEARVLGPEAPTVLVTTAAAPASRRKRLAATGVTLWELPEGPGGVDLKSFLKKAAREGWLDLFFEGGRGVATSLAAQGFVDRLIVVQAPLLLGGSLTWLDDLGLRRLADGIKLGRPEVRRVGEDVILSWMSRTWEKAVLDWSPD